MLRTRRSICRWPALSLGLHRPAPVLNTAVAEREAQPVSLARHKHVSIGRRKFQKQNTFAGTHDCCLVDACCRYVRSSVPALGVTDEIFENIVPTAHGFAIERRARGSHERRTDAVVREENAHAPITGVARLHAEVRPNRRAQLRCKDPRLIDGGERCNRADEQRSDGDEQVIVDVPALHETLFARYGSSIMPAGALPMHPTARRDTLVPGGQPWQLM